MAYNLIVTSRGKCKNPIYPDFTKVAAKNVVAFFS